MKKKYLIFFLILIVVGILVYYLNQDTVFLETKNQFLKNSSKKDTVSNAIFNKKEKSSTIMINKNEIENKVNEFYNNLKFSQKRHYFATCFRMVELKNGELEVNFQELDVLLNNFIDSQNLAGYQPSKNQLKIVKSMFEKCGNIIDFKDTMFNEISNNPYSDEKGIGYLYQDLKEILHQQGADYAIEYGENNLMSLVQTERMDAFRFLTEDTTWLNSINESLDLNLRDGESWGYMNTALRMLTCEYGAEDCGVNSVMMYSNCFAVSEVCGMTGDEFFRFSTTELSRVYIDQYISYLRLLNLEIP